MNNILDMLKMIDKADAPKTKKLNESVSLNISATGEGPNDVVDMMSKLMNLTGMKPVTNDMMPAKINLPMVKTIADVGNYADEAARTYANDVGEDITDEAFANEPEEEVQDTDYMVNTLAGGLDRAKKTYPKVSKADNPMQPVTEQIANRLMSEYNIFKSNQ